MQYAPPEVLLQCLGAERSVCNPKLFVKVLLNSAGAESGSAEALDVLMSGMYNSMLDRSASRGPQDMW